MIRTKQLLLPCLLAVAGVLYADEAAAAPTQSLGAAQASAPAATTTAAVTLSAVPGEAVTTYGWADQAKLKYASSKKITLIDDASYPDPKKKRQAFTKAIGSSAAAFIVISGDIDLSDGAVTDSDHSYYDAFDKTSHRRLHDDIIYPVTSNKTIIGVQNARICYGGLQIREASNIIIRNVTFWDAHGSTEYDTAVTQYSESKASIDNVVIRDSKGIWIDHCTFSDGVCHDMSRNYNHDGLLDIPAGQFVTISYCDFHNHDKVMLVGTGEKATNPAERTITLHHNYFHGTTQRTPRTRGTLMHIYNNVYDNIGVPENTGYCLGPGTEACFAVQNNYFGSRLGNIVDFYDKSTGTKATAQLYYAGNSEDLSAENTKLSNSKQKRALTDFLTDTIPWKISYDYESAMTSWEEAKAVVLTQAGAGKPVTVAGTTY